MRNVLSLIAVLAATPAVAQVGISPLVTTPAAWERFAVRVINQTDTATVSVRVEVPEVIMILGVEPKAGWAIQTSTASDTVRQAIEWTGGTITKGQYGEFAFLGRLDANAKKDDMAFPVRIQRSNGSVVEWRKRPGEPYAAPRVEIAGTVSISGTGQIAMAGAAVGLAIVAIVIAIALGSRRR